MNKILAKLSGCIFIFLFFFSIENLGQGYNKSQNSVYLDLFAASGLAGISANYDRVLFSSSNMFISGRLGIGTLVEASGSSGGANAIFPFGVSIMYGTNHKVEICIGRTFISEDSFNHVNAGYRYMPIDVGFLFRVGSQLFMIKDGDSIFGGYISFGFAF